MSEWRWGKAGQRLTDGERMWRRRQQGKDKRQFDTALTEAQAKWRRGAVYPDSITAALDMQNLYGPEVDKACGVEEPAVDMWEAGELYPTWEQLLALSALTGFPVHFFTTSRPAPPSSVMACSPRGCEVIEPKPTVSRYPRAVVAECPGTFWT